MIDLASNNYLVLPIIRKLVEAALAATRKYGAGSGVVRTISGTMSLHLELERRIAAFKNIEARVAFQSGFATNRLVGAESPGSSSRRGFRATPCARA